MEPSPRTPSGEPPTIGGFGEADVAKAMLQLNVVRQIAEGEEFERVVALASDTDVTVVLIGTTEEVFNERDEVVWRMSASLIQEAHRASRKVGICGETPSDCPDFAALLVEQEIVYTELRLRPYMIVWVFAAPSSLLLCAAVSNMDHPALAGPTTIPPQPRGAPRRSVPSTNRSEYS